MFWPERCQTAADTIDKEPAGLTEAAAGVQSPPSLHPAPANRCGSNPARGVGHWSRELLSLLPTPPLRGHCWPMYLKRKGQQKLGVDENPGSIPASKSVGLRGRGGLAAKRSHRQHCGAQKGCDRRRKRPVCLTEVLSRAAPGPRGQGSPGDNAEPRTLTPAPADHESSHHCSISLPYLFYCPIFKIIFACQ